MRIEVEKLARDDLVPALQTGMTMDNPAESVGPAEDQFVVAYLWRMGKDRGYVQGAIVKFPQIVKQSQYRCRAIESKGQGCIPRGYILLRG
ncbi:hypothetical protein E5176_32070 [Ensifer adhaerens]|nr:hypothetical protein [Ensifer adhaerens]MDF8357333.1 hypothetical protein [Ensifer adhaerens]THA59008.1 hypothetical protein E5176_32070 [Ensifer adhaerens]